MENSFPYAPPVPASVAESGAGEWPLHRPTRRPAARGCWVVFIPRNVASLSAGALAGPKLRIVIMPRCTWQQQTYARRVEGS
jgi:hypothetical protein